MEFLLTIERKNELLIQGFDSTTQGLTELVEFCERLKTAKEIFRTQGEGPQENKKTKQSGELHQPARLVQSKGLYQASKPLEEDAHKSSKFKNKIKNIPVCPLNGY